MNATPNPPEDQPTIPLTLEETLALWEQAASAAGWGPWQAKLGYIGSNRAAFLTNDGLYDGIHIHWGEERHGVATEESKATAAYIAFSNPDFALGLISRIRHELAAAKSASPL